jgi:hypothetical protein
MEDVTTFLSLTTGVFPIACKTESRIALLYAMVFSPRPAAAYAFGIGCSKIHIGTRRFQPESLRGLASVKFACFTALVRLAVNQELRFVRNFDPRQNQNVILTADETPS